jgi:hypothetical protein
LADPDAIQEQKVAPGYDPTGKTDVTPTIQNQIITDNIGNVGIGTASPLAVLHVSASSTVPIFESTTSGNGVGFTLRADSANRWRLWQNGSGANYRYDWIYEPTALTAMSLTPDGYLTVNGGVGIGVAKPGIMLAVTGQSAFSRDGTDGFGQNYTVAIAEYTQQTGKKAQLGFHNGGVAEGYIRLDVGTAGRTFVFGSEQTDMDGLFTGELTVNQSIHTDSALTANGNASVGGNMAVAGSTTTNNIVLRTDTSPSGIEWANVSAALGRAVYDGNYSVDARAGDLVLRPSGGSRLVLARGADSPDHPAAIVIDGSDTYIKTSLFISGSDLVLYGRNSGGTGGAGRALVDGGSGAGLMINYGNDFGSWRIEGPSNANLNLGGHSISNCGALVEANLQTPKELASDKIDRFEEGDLLCWGIDQLELCTVVNDPLVQAVADSNGRPIVIGAEKVKVLGPVKRGDYLVTSDAPGYAIASAKPTFGIVIAQALEDFAGERGLIKAMIRKM